MGLIIILILTHAVNASRICIYYIARHYSTCNVYMMVTKKIIIWTWNVGTQNECSKLENVELEMERST